MAGSTRRGALLALALAASCAHDRRVHPRAAEEVRRGYAHLAAGDPERAEVAFEHALAFDPDFPEALNGLGIVDRTRGGLEKARARYERAIRLDRHFAEGHANLGELLLVTGEEEEAEEELRAALRIDPDLADARQNLARALVGRALRLEPGPRREELLERARRELLHLLESDPARAAAHHDLAWLDYRAGRYGPAAEGYRRAAELDPSSREAFHGQCISLARLGRCAEAVRACQACLSVAPGAEPCEVSLRGARACAGP